MSDFRQLLHDRTAGVDAMRWSALALAVGFAGLVTLFVAGYALTDPGGWVGVGGTAALVLSVVGLTALALFHPRTALAVLAVVACLPVAFGLWALVDYSAAHSWEDHHGPLTLVLVVAVSAPAAVAGLVRPLEAGWLILAVSLGPFVLEAVGAASHFYEPLSVVFLLGPTVAAGVLLLASAHGQRSPRQTRPPARTPVPH